MIRTGNVLDRSGTRDGVGRDCGSVEERGGELGDREGGPSGRGNWGGEGKSLREGTECCGAGNGAGYHGVGSGTGSRKGAVRSGPRGVRLGTGTRVRDASATSVSRNSSRTVKSTVNCGVSHVAYGTERYGVSSGSVSIVIHPHHRQV